MGLFAVASGSFESLLRELGSDQFIDYTKSRPEEIGYEVDLVLDAVGGHAGSRFLRMRGGACARRSATTTKRPRSWAPCSRAPRSVRAVSAR